LCTFSQFRHQIWNKHNILRFLVPILTYLRKKVFCCILRKILSAQIGQYGYQNEQNFMLISNLKTKLRKSAPMRNYLKKNYQKSSFLIVTFLSSIFFQFCLRIWNHRKILCFLVPILTYLKKNSFLLYFVRNRQCVDQIQWQELRVNVPTYPKIHRVHFSKLQLSS